MFEKGILIDPDIDPTNDDEDEYEISANVTCVCGQRVYLECISHYEDVDYLEGTESMCPSCKREYIVEIDDDDNLVVTFNN